MTLFAIWLACAAQPVVPDPEPTSTVTDVSAEEEGVLAGTVENGRFTDERHGFSVGGVPGWIVQPGPREGSLRVVMTHSAEDVGGTNAVVEVWAFPGRASTPRPRGDCLWTFVDTAGYRQGPGLQEAGVDMDVTVATCVPHDATTGRRFAYLVPGPGWVWQIEMLVPSETLIDGKRAADQLLETFSMADG